MPSLKYVKVGEIDVKENAYFTVKSLVQRNYSANKIQDILKGTEYAMRRTNLLATIRDIKGQEAKKDLWKYTPTKYIIGDKMHEETKVLLDKNYAYTVKIKTYSNLLKSEVDRYVRLKTDEKYSVERLREMAEETLGEGVGYANYEEELISSKIITAVKRPALL